MAVAAGRALSAKNEDQLRQAATLIDNVLASLDDAEKSNETGHKGDQPSTDSGTVPEPPEGADAPGEQVKTGGRPALALATITNTYTEGA